jgi:RNA polymerase sigma-70 factor, ECF subfamily
LGGFKGKGTFSNWLSKIAVRCCYDFWRSYYRKKKFLFSQFPDDCQVWLEDLMSDQLMEKERDRLEALNLLDWAFGQLSASERMILTLTYLNDCSIAEAASLMGWSLFRIKIQSYRARRKLRRILANIQAQI